MTVEEAKKLTFFLMDKKIVAFPQVSNCGACVNILVEGECYTLKKIANFYGKTCVE